MYPLSLGKRHHSTLHIKLERQAGILLHLFLAKVLAMSQNFKALAKLITSSNFYLECKYLSFKPKVSIWLGYTVYMYVIFASTNGLSCCGRIEFGRGKRKNVLHANMELGALSLTVARFVTIYILLSFCRFSPLFPLCPLCPHCSVDRPIDQGGMVGGNRSTSDWH